MTALIPITLILLFAFLVTHRRYVRARAAAAAYRRDADRLRRELHWAEADRDAGPVEELDLRALREQRIKHSN